jgi:hypothetical protein
MYQSKRECGVMIAFDRINSGVNGLDRVVDSIRLGDNVVWQLVDIEDYRYFAVPFAKKAMEENRNLIYMRFAMHPPILEPQEGLKIVELDPDSGFENFTVQVHEVIADEGAGAFYVFDCLSELQTAWAADLMMGNFFTVTCPYLFELDTVAFFAIIRNRHSYDTVARIRETTQLLIDAYHSEENRYIHPIKVWRRYSDTMFLPHISEGDNFLPLTDGLETSRFFHLVASQGTRQSGHKLDFWDRLFLKAERIAEEEQEEGAGLEHSERSGRESDERASHESAARAGLKHGGMDLAEAGRNTTEAGRSPTETFRSPKAEMLEKLCKLVIGRDKNILGLALSHFQLEDILEIKEKMIGSGYIGGKAVGMLLARNILQNWKHKLEPHDSFYIGSDVFYTFLVQNGWWKLRLEQRTPEGYFSAAGQLKEKIPSGVFPQIVNEQFRSLLEYYGQSPIIVRSSSLLEDNFGTAFAGKYESIFCTNMGTLEERLQEFVKAVKQVYASAMDESALVYRQQRGLDKSDEQMAILVQRVSGSRHDGIFMPAVAGVAYSYNAYAWNRDIDPKAGLVRLVVGLGTRAVERTQGDYPRVASLDKPQLRLQAGKGDNRRFSQQYADVLDLNKNDLQTISINELSPLLPDYLRDLLLEHDRDAEALMAERGMNRDYMLSTCSRLLAEKEFITCLRSMLEEIQQYYGYPVDVEFTVNFSKEHDFVINLLQCRPLQVKGLGKKVTIPEAKRKDIFFSVRDGTMGGNIYQPVDTVIFVDPEAYSNADTSTKYKTARLIGKLNSRLGKKRSGLLLAGPGRWGTTTPELGVPVSFAEISNIRVLCEVAFERGGFVPELSFGSHFFQDLVEADIFYTAIFPKSKDTVYRPELLHAHENILTELLPEEHGMEQIVKVYDTADQNLILLSDITEEKAICMMRDQPMEKAD